MRVAGIDGCRGGWISIVFDHGKWSYVFERHLHILVPALRAQLIFIDMPIGLSSKTFLRTVDSLARKELSPHKSSSVFTPPCREALQAKDYREALEINRHTIGKGISIQAWNIAPKVREADTLLKRMPQLKHVLYEAHPEICFKYLNDGEVLRSSKKSPQGALERTSMIHNVDVAIKRTLESALLGTLRKQVAQDDINDAAALAISAKQAAENGIRLVHNMDAIDALQTPVRVAYGVGSAIGSG